MAKRRQIWQLEHRFHCSVAGTCLTLQELCKLLVRAGYRLPEGLSDYQLHCSFVTLLGERGAVAKLTQKYLDRKFARTLERFRPLTEAGALEALWEQCLQEGEVAGPFWAVITHPASDERLLYRVFGEVHMLSHLQGASVRVDLEELARLRRELPRLQKRIAELQERLQKRERELQELRRTCETIPRLKERIEAYRIEVERLHGGEVFRGLREELRKAQESNAFLHSQRERLLQELEALRREVRERGEKLEALREELSKAVAEREALERWLSHLLEPDQAPSGCALRGKRVLYVGGRCRLWPYLRAFVERQGGELFCHDGGLEESVRRVDELVARCDLVVCPIDRVSHDAAFRIRRRCEQLQRELLFLPRASLSTFVRGILEWAEKSAEAVLGAATTSGPVSGPGRPRARAAPGRGG